jgi:Domain of unknown function (DUF4411)
MVAPIVIRCLSAMLAVPTPYLTSSQKPPPLNSKIYSVTHFQQNIEQQKLLKGGKNADPFVIAKAAIDGRAVVTMEQLRPNAVKIPNICQHFSVKCLSLEEFMEEEGWQF